MRCRQVVAVVLKELLCELAQEQAKFSAALGAEAKQPVAKQTVAKQPVPLHRLPSAVILDRCASEHSASSVEIDAKTRLDAVNKSAAHYGVAVGQTVAEARALVAHLRLVIVKEEELQRALERVTDALLRFGSTVSWQLPDTVWVDVTGSAHLFGGEDALLDEICAVLEELGHRARLALSEGPRLARAFAHWETKRRGKVAVVVTAQQKEACLKALPITSLPLEREVTIGLAQLGLLSVGDLMEIDSAVVSSRLGAAAMTALELLRGEDPTPLKAYRPQVLPCETLTWDEPLNGSEPVLFALRRLTTQVGARLRGRGLAAEVLELTLKHDPAIARFRRRAADSSYTLKLSAPLFRAEDLWRVLAARVNKLQVDVPNVGVVLKVLSTTSAKQRQLDLAVGFSKLDAGDPERMAVLFGELAADIGTQNFGTLRLANTHKPEKITILSPVETLDTRRVMRKRRRATQQQLEPELEGSRQAALSKNATVSNVDVPTDSPCFLLPSRLLTTPLLVNGPFRAGEMLPLGQHLYTIQHVVFERRLEAVEWWLQEPCCRDYLRLWLTSSHGELQVLAFVDRVTQRRFVQGWYD